MCSKQTADAQIPMGGGEEDDDGDGDPMDISASEVRHVLCLLLPLVRYH